MHPFKCPDCGEESSDSSCPNCSPAQESGALDPRLEHAGDIVNGSRAACAPRLRMNPLRYLWSSILGPFFRGWLVLAALTTAAFALHWWVAGGLLALPLVAVGLMLGWATWRMSVVYHNGLLTPGIVVSTNPLEFVAVANMSTGFGPHCWAMCRVDIARLPVHGEAVGTTFPCVSYFNEGEHFERWGKFTPQPLSFGTGNRKRLAAQRAKIGEADFEELQQFLAAGKTPKTTGEMVWLDAGGNVTGVESLAKRQSPPAGAPPPLPVQPPPLPAGPPPLPAPPPVDAVGEFEAFFATRWMRATLAGSIVGFSGAVLGDEGTKLLKERWAELWATHFPGETPVAAAGLAVAHSFEGRHLVVAIRFPATRLAGGSLLGVALLGPCADPQWGPAAREGLPFRYFVLRAADQGNRVEDWSKETPVDLGPAAQPAPRDFVEWVLDRTLRMETGKAAPTCPVPPVAPPAAG